MNWITNYINDALTELRQVRWPTRQQAIRFSIVVISFVMACAIFFGAVDFGLAELVKFLLSFAS